MLPAGPDGPPVRAGARLNPGARRGLVLGGAAALLAAPWVWDLLTTTDEEAIRALLARAYAAMEAEDAGRLGALLDEGFELASDVPRVGSGGRQDATLRLSSWFADSDGIRFFPGPVEVVASGDVADVAVTGRSVFRSGEAGGTVAVRFAGSVLFRRADGRDWRIARVSVAEARPGW